MVRLLSEQLPDNLYYHSVEHTLYVLEKTAFIAEKEGVSKSDMFLLKVAALYHDSGFIEGSGNHEAKGCEIARKDLASFDFDPKDIDAICNIIMATKIPQNPQNHLEEIIADADLEYLGTNTFAKTSDLLFKELKENSPKLTAQDWLAIQQDFLSKHKYHTKYCKRYKEHRKVKNLKSLR